MPWNNQNGGGNNSNGGNRGPWGQGTGGGPGSGGQQPPDLEELLRRGQDQMQNLLPGGGMSAVVIFALVLVGWAMTGMYRVDQKELGVELRFGKFSQQTLPGFHYHLPYPIETVLKPQVQVVNEMHIGDLDIDGTVLTGDENLSKVPFSVFWRISDAASFLFNVRDPNQIILTTAESIMREEVGRRPIDDILTANRAEVEAAVMTSLQSTLDSYGVGVLITQVQMQGVEPHRDAIEAYREVQAAEAEKERMRNEAEAYANRVVPEAQGRAARIIQEAEGYKEQTIAEADGEAQRFISVYNEYKKAPDVTRQRIFLETMEDVFDGMDKIIIDDQGGGQGVVPYLPLNELRKNRP